MQTFILICSALILGGFCLPDFLNKVSSSERQEFLEILDNQQLTTTQQIVQFEEWANAANVAKEYREWNEEVARQKTVITENVMAVLANITTVYNDIGGVVSNMNLTRQEQTSKIRDLASTFPREVRALSFITKHYRPEDKTPVLSQQFLTGKWDSDESEEQ